MNLPQEIKCDQCPRGIMYKSKLSEFHQYYRCNQSKCNNVTGLPLSQHKETETDSDFGSGSFKSQREE